MDLPPYYPVNDFGPAMKGIVIGGLGVTHVFLAMFAIGGGMLMCYFQWLASTGREPNARKFVDGYFKVLVLISFVLGAVTGVAMWFVSIQVSARTIGMMVGEFHWVWAIEWTFFSLEISAGYCFYRYGPRLSDPIRLRLLVIYSVASWFSLFWINGILSWQLTPGAWIETGYMWYGFFNAGFWPSLIYRTIAAMTIASLAASIVINAMPSLSREERERLVSRASLFLSPIALMPILGVWWIITMPPDSRQMILGGSIVMVMFLGLSIGSAALVGAYAIIGILFRKLYINGATATLLCGLAFAASMGGEFVREGVRKPFTIRQVLYSHSVQPDELANLREVGCVTNDPFPLRNPDQYPTDQLKLGARVFRFHCSVCHTTTGANALVHLAGSWSDDQKRLNIAKLQYTKTFMPPFSGNAEELEALVQFISWQTAETPESWEESDFEAVRPQIETWLDEAGVEPGYLVEHGELAQHAE
ncbi:MAG: c-type cytochrome [bacterium]|nr:c-type cytochrome [bacterium]